jgi:aminopeptidase N
VTDQILELDAINPQVAARIVSAFNQWKRYEPRRSELMRAELERIASQPAISKDVAEIVERALQK